MTDDMPWIGKKINEHPFIALAIPLSLLFMFSHIYNPQQSCESKGKIYLSWNGFCISKSKLGSIETEVVSVLKSQDNIKVDLIQARTSYESDMILGVSERSEKYGCYSVQTGFLSGYYKCALEN